MHDGDERQLLAAVARREVEAFDRLYRRYYKRVLGFAMRITQRSDSAEEVVDDTMFTVWRKAGDFAGRSRPSTWIFGIAYRKALKAAQRTPAASHEIDPDTVADDRQLEGLEAIFLREQVAQAIGRLPPEQRAVVELTYLHGYTYAEIAEIAECPLGTVKTRMRNARTKLRDILIEHAGDAKETVNAEK